MKIFSMAMERPPKPQISFNLHNPHAQATFLAFAFFLYVIVAPALG